MSVTYTKYQHIEKIGSGEVEGILKGTCYLFYKIDGTNACVWFDEDTNSLQFGSRNIQSCLIEHSMNSLGTIGKLFSKSSIIQQLTFLHLKKNIVMNLLRV